MGVTATGPGGSSTAATLTITVIPPGAGGECSSTNVTANTSSNLITPVVTGVATSLAISSSAAHGVVVIAGMNVKYTPNTGYSGPDSLNLPRLVRWSFELRIHLDQCDCGSGFPTDGLEQRSECRRQQQQQCPKPYDWRGYHRIVNFNTAGAWYRYY